MVWASALSPPTPRCRFSQKAHTALRPRSTCLMVAATPFFARPPSAVSRTVRPRNTKSGAAASLCSCDPRSAQSRPPPSAPRSTAPPPPPPGTRTPPTHPQAPHAAGLGENVFHPPRGALEAPTRPARPPRQPPPLAPPPLPLHRLPHHVGGVLARYPHRHRLASQRP